MIYPNPNPNQHSHARTRFHPHFLARKPADLLCLICTTLIVAGVRNQPAKNASSTKELLHGAASGVSLVPTLATDAGSSDDDGGESGDDSRSVVGQFVEISGDGDGDGDGDIGQSTASFSSGGGSSGATEEDVEGGYQAGAAGAIGGPGVGGEEEREEGGEGREGWLVRNLRPRLPSRGDMLIYGGFLLNVSTKGTISCFETIGAEYAMTNFSLTSAEVGEGGRGRLKASFMKKCCSVCPQ